MKEFKDYMDIKMQNKQYLFDAMHEEYKNRIKQSTEKEIKLKAIELTQKLDKASAIQQCKDEAYNSETPEELDFWANVHNQILMFI